MKQTALAELKQDTRARTTQPRALLENKPMEPERILLCLPDVAVLDRRGSKTGLYKKKDGRILPLEDLSGHEGGVLVRAKEKLQLCEKDILAEQGTKIIYVRENINGGCHVVRAETEEKYAGYEPNGTTVAEYIILNKLQAQRLLSEKGMAEIKEKKPTEYPMQMERLEAAGIVMYNALHGGC